MQGVAGAVPGQHVAAATEDDGGHRLAQGRQQRQAARVRVLGLGPDC
ncbi:hypothetical protein [Actinomadura chibensis]|nr:hypothetical protein [Actinomadura chibensis]